LFFLARAASCHSETPLAGAKNLARRTMNLSHGEMLRFAQHDNFF
jgi:hypothetical protein